MVITKEQANLLLKRFCWVRIKKETDESTRGYFVFVESSDGNLTCRTAQGRLLIFSFNEVLHVHELNQKDKDRFLKMRQGMGVK